MVSESLLKWLVFAPSIWRREKVVLESLCGDLSWSLIGVSVKK
ncbi:hypothetical protein [Rubritalea tangerina]